jgi:hypothetical protein
MASISGEPIPRAIASPLGPLGGLTGRPAFAPVVGQVARSAAFLAWMALA